MAGNEILQRLPRRRPTNEREWSTFLNDLSLAVGDLVEYETNRIKSQLLIPMELSGNRGAIQSMLPISAEDLGGSVGAKIVVAAHYCKHGSQQINYGAGEIGSVTSPLPYSAASPADPTVYYVYIDNPAFEDGKTDYQASTNYLDTMADGRYYVGEVEMPEDGAPPVTGGGGGGGGVSGRIDPGGGGIFP